MEDNTNTKCQSCGYSLIFDPETQGLTCPQCGAGRKIAKTPLVDKKEYFSDSRVDKNQNVDKTLVCESCGAKTNSTKNINGVCPYCGTTNLKHLNNAIEYNPDAIVPFRITKEKAKENYIQWLKTRKFVPKKLKSSAKLEKMEGRYIPSWNFDYKVNSSISGIGIKEHTRTVSRPGPDGTTVRETETYTTRHPFSGTRFDVFDNDLYTGTNLVSIYDFESMGRWGLKDLKTYNPEYLLGFLSSGYDISLHTAYKDVVYRAKEEIKDRAKKQFSYDDYERLEISSDFNSVMWRYIYLPIWLCGFKYKSKDYKFFVNGYTGYVNGEVPRSGWKIFGLVMGIILGVGVLAGIIALLASL